MFSIRTYNDTMCELKMAKKRLRLLQARRNELWFKYFPITTKPKEIMVDGGKRDNDKMADYLYELHEIDIGIGMSLADEIKRLDSNIKKLKECLNYMTKTLSSMQGIEYQLYYEIVYNNVPISKAVEIVANRNNKDMQTIWKNYYRKIKKYVKNTVKIQ